MLLCLVFRSYCCASSFVCFFFFQAEDGIRDKLVTGVQTCALPISQRFGKKSCLFPGRSLCWRLTPARGLRSEERRVGKSVDLGGRRIIKKKKKKRKRTRDRKLKTIDKKHESAKHTLVSSGCQHQRV